MLKAIFNWFTGKPAPEAEAPRVPETVAPYKVETPAPAAPVATAAPAPAQCGCGRSPTGLCVGLHKLTAEEWATHADNPAKATKAKAPAKPRTAWPTNVTGDDSSRRGWPHPPETGDCSH